MSVDNRWSRRARSTKVSHPLPTAADVKTEAEVEAMTAAWDRAHRDRDAVGARRLLAATFVSLSDRALDTEAYLSAHFDADLQIETYRTEIETLSILGESVVLSGRLHLAGRRGGEPVHGTRLVSQTWSRAGDDWVIVALHSSFEAAAPDHTTPRCTPSQARPASPAEVFRRVLAGMQGSGPYDLGSLYAPDVMLRHPLGHPRPAVVNGRDAVQQLADNLRERFEMTASNVVIHHSDDPEVVIATWDYRTRARHTSREIETSNVCIMRVRNGKVVASSDYHDHTALAGLLEEPATTPS